MATENYTETTGPVTRVGVIAETEDEAIAFAEDMMGEACAWADRGRPEYDEWEVCFVA